MCGGGKSWCLLVAKNTANNIITRHRTSSVDASLLARLLGAAAGGRGGPNGTRPPALVSFDWPAVLDFALVGAFLPFFLLLFRLGGMMVT